MVEKRDSLWWACWEHSHFLFPMLPLRVSKGKAHGRGGAREQKQTSLGFAELQTSDFLKNRRSESSLPSSRSTETIRPSSMLAGSLGANAREDLITGKGSGKAQQRETP